MSKPIKTMQVVGAGKPGGAEKFYFRLVRAFHEKPNSAVEVLPIVRENSWLADRLEAHGIPYKTAPFGGMFDFQTRKQLEDMIRTWQPDVIQTWMNRASKFLPKTDVPTVGRLGGYYNLKYYKNCDHLIGNTEDLVRYIYSQGWPQGNASYVPNFVDIPREDFRDHRLDVRDEYDIPENAKVIFMAGRLHENKGLDIALYALSKLPENVYMIIAGTGPEESALKAAIEADGLTSRVRFVGWVNSIAPLFAAADYFMVPSRIEPLGNVVLEAWAHRMPIIATDAVGPKNLIRHEETGLLVPREDDKALAYAVERLLDNPGLAESIAREGHREVKRHFTQETVVEQYLKLYRKLTKV